MDRMRKRKIHVYREANELDGCEDKWVYVWSTNAYPTCKAAKEAAEKLHPSMKFEACFAND